MVFHWERSHGLCSSNCKRKYFNNSQLTFNPNKCGQQWHSCCSPVHYIPSSHSPPIKVWLILECPSQMSSLRTLLYSCPPAQAQLITLFADHGLLYSELHSNINITSVMNYRNYGWDSSPLVLLLRMSSKGGKMMPYNLSCYALLCQRTGLD